MKYTRKNKLFSLVQFGIIALLILNLMSLPIMASSHAEAPLTSMDRYADNTDVYAFRSTEPGREGFVTLIANYIPFQDPSGGPQFYRFDDSVMYEIKVDNTGDGLEDITYQFQFTTQIVRPSTAFGMNTLNQDGVIMNERDPDYNMPQDYTLRVINSATGPNGQVLGTGVRMPPSNIGPRVTPNYEENLGRRGVHTTPSGVRFFAGQRDESFFIDVGGVFDLFNLRSLAANGGVDSLRGFNVNTLAVEVPIQNLTRTGTIPASSTAPGAVIGVFATASRRGTQVINADNTRSTSGPWRQISRLGNPLVNELIIPLGLKDAFNALSPVNDAVAAPSVLDPELPKLIKAALSAFNGININIPPAPRNDLVAIFATGIPAGTVPGAPTFTTFLSDGQPHEYIRLNVAIAPTNGTAAFSRLGLLGGDPAGFPNGRRVTDDVVDIDIRAVLGGTPFTPAFNVAPNNSIGDGVAANFEGFLTRFPYLQTPNQGNQPRPANFPAAQLSAPQTDENQPPIVDANGFLTNNKNK